MYTAIAIYGTDSILPEKALFLGRAFFRYVNLPITNTGYYKYLSNGDHEGDHEIINVSVDELENKINNKNATSFRLYSEKKGCSPWLASFGYTTNDFGGFFHLDAQYPNKLQSYDEIIDFIEELSNTVNLTYGIVYSCDKMNKAFYYAAGNNLANIYPYENSSLFKKDTPGRYHGQESYKKNKLRMAYPLNIMNENHLLIDVNGLALREWILEDKNHGTLEKLSNGAWLWKIESSIIDSVNKYLGDCGVLISWKNSPTKIAPRKIP
ncbi:hypothetical protein [Erwinia psidii]|uniref:DUF3396 domain-containing protein n=1 Tax=Erwinia psidii TaxID=69224 RepID=A0A3N6SIG5_9GAMM|nr:hypothetical protein [Erwinia psidii]MCX8957465.1 hypothetical protein [Erwinia psidii]MCX8960517.1 hypothetical protein [Erwinia psidii]RQM39743.1 hypothetical protein EB241_04635 [Erwinia psidii]